MLSRLKEHLSTQAYSYILLLALGALMSFYYFIYVPNNEQTLNRHAMRLLNNKSNAILEKYKSYGNVLKSAPMTYLSNWYFKINPSKENVWIGHRPGTLDIYETNPGQGSSNVYKINRLSLEVKGKWNRELLPEFNHDSLGMWQAESGNVHFIYTLPVVINKIPEENPGEKKEVCFWVYANNFTNNLNTNSLFQDFFLVADQPGNKSRSRGFVHDGKVIGNSGFGLFNFFIPDSIRSKGLGLFTTTLRGEKYRVYFQHINLKRGTSVFAVGLISQLEFQRQSREVTNWFITFCLISALVLIFLLPVLKLFTLSGSERLSASDARLTVFSMILCVFMATTVLLGLYIDSAIEDEESDRTLKDLATEMVKKAEKEVDSLVLVLNRPNLFVNTLPLVNSRQFRQNYPNVRYNEVFALAIDEPNLKDGQMRKLFYEKHTLNVMDLDTFPINVGHRDYFKFIQKANEIKSEEKKRHEYHHIEAINSFTTGSSEIAVSLYHPDSKRVHVITSKMPPLIKAVLPGPFQYIITDNDGNVQLKSNGSNPGENFIQECDFSRNVSGLIRNKANDYVNFSYVTIDCRGYIMPMLNDWNIIVYYELQESRYLAARIFALCLFSLILIVIFTAIIHLALFTDSRKSHIIKSKTFFYQWLNVNNASEETWFNLFAFVVIFIGFQFLWLSWFNDFILSVLLCCIGITLFYLISYFKLAIEGSNKKSSAVKVLVTILVVLLILFVLAGSEKHYLFLLLLGSALAVWYFKPNWVERLRRIVTGLPAHASYLFSSLVLLAIMPAWILISVHYNHESKVQGFFYLFQDLSNLQTSPVMARETGLDYTDKKAGKETYDMLDTLAIDFRLYSMLRSFQVESRNLPAEHLGVLPYRDTSYHFYNSDDALRVTGPAFQSSNLHYKKDRERNLNNMQWSNSPGAIGVYIVAIIALVIVWKSCQHINRKIFFDLHGICFHYSRRKTRYTLKWEFTNSNEPRHPLYSFSKRKLRELFNYYKEHNGKTNTPELYDECIFKLQGMASKAYDCVFQDCTEEEKLFLYDLAEDGVANLSNPGMIARLSEKGLVRVYPQLEIVNRSLANYILTVVNSNTSLKDKDNEHRKGQWHKLRPVMIIVIIASFAFLSVVSEDLMGRISSLLASVALFIPSIINIVSSVGKVTGRSASN